MHNLIKKYISENNNYTYDYRGANDRVAIIIETREVPHLDWVIKNIKYHTGWEVILFYYENDVSHIDCERRKLPADIANVTEYNHLLKSVKFWESLRQEHILIFQSDSFMLRSGIEGYLKYDYVGAPWNWSNDPKFKDDRYEDLSIFKKGGNGGFSLRKKSVMLKILSNHYVSPDGMDMYISEDMFFSKYLENYPELEDAKDFCVETIFNENPIAVHAIDRYLSYDQIEKILFDNVV